MKLTNKLLALGLLSSAFLTFAMEQAPAIKYAQGPIKVHLMWVNTKLNIVDAQIAARQYKEQDLIIKRNVLAADALRWKEKLSRKNQPWFEEVFAGKRLEQKSLGANF